MVVVLLPLRSVTEQEMATITCCVATDLGYVDDPDPSRKADRGAPVRVDNRGMRAATRENGCLSRGAAAAAAGLPVLMWFLRVGGSREKPG